MSDEENKPQQRQLGKPCEMHPVERWRDKEIACSKLIEIARTYFIVQFDWNCEGEERRVLYRRIAFSMEYSTSRWFWRSGKGAKFIWAQTPSEEGCALKKNIKVWLIRKKTPYVC